MWLELYWINISFASHDMNNNAYGFLYQVGVKIKKEEKIPQNTGVVVYGDTCIKMRIILQMYIKKHAVDR